MSLPANRSFEQRWKILTLMSTKEAANHEPSSMTQNTTPSTNYRATLHHQLAWSVTNTVFAFIAERIFPSVIVDLPMQQTKAFPWMEIRVSSGIGGSR